MEFNNNGQTQHHAEQTSKDPIANKHPLQSFRCTSKLNYTLQQFA